MNAPPPSTMPAPRPAPNGAEAIDPKTTLHLSLSVDHINKILAALGDRPFKEVADVINAVKGQGDMALTAMRNRNGTVPQVPVSEMPSDNTVESIPPRRNGGRKH